MKNLTLFILTLFLLAGLSIITFKHTDNLITGRQIIGTRLTIINVSSSDCSFNLTTGWNLASFYCIGMINPRAHALESINSSYEAIFTYNTLDPADPWKSYNPSLPSWTVQQLNYMDRFSGYYILMNEDHGYFYSGTKKFSTILLQPGWNLIGYPSISSNLVNATLENASINILKMYNHSTGNYLVYVINGTQEFLYMDTYNAYWINSSAVQTIFFSGD